jgi:hypothetical protein
MSKRIVTGHSLPHLKKTFYVCAHHLQSLNYNNPPPKWPEPHAIIVGKGGNLTKVSVVNTTG